MNRLLAITVGVALAVPALAARDSAGTYTLSPSSPFVTGTPISSSVMNTRFADLASELSDSLSRSGKGAMLAPLKLYDGSVTLPGLSFGSETGTGFYRAGAGDLRCSVTGTDRLKITSAGVTVTGDVSATGGVTATGGLSSDSLTARTVTSATVKGAVADGASAVGVILDNSIALANATAKIASFRSNGAEKASISASGQLLAPALEIIQGNAFIDFKDSAAEDYDARIIKTTGANLEVVGTPLKVPTPVDATDAATKGYVDTAAAAAPTFKIVIESGGTARTDYKSGNITGVTFSKTGAGAYRIAHASIASYKTVVLVDVRSATPAYATMTYGAGTVDIKMSDGADHEHGLAVWIN